MSTSFKGVSFLQGSVHNTDEIPEDVLLRWSSRNLISIVETTEEEIPSTEKIPATKEIPELTYVPIEDEVILKVEKAVKPQKKYSKKKKL